ncbi:GNAT family N-acetyltransferase [Streptococcus loxodontisalivarius]|uniref:Ribosomal protein S18 acetylase RimI-like enzyme n=1 Tax=Streptococcus loxodontisalivarius TaxID=1349415 RepID=A0ABS2PQL1_9STRE|nr:GNAT family N-acetyltransferase [Streptococcus loxodontisalivarius]MBM7642275.1 ribosomal protein S18 acetylase RimI-like enzyme [Streptococcus loxodontisalivarius]
MIIRPMQDCDREAVLTLQNTGWTALTSPVYDRKWTEKDLEKNLANGISFFVAEVDDKIAGVLDFGPYYPFPAGKHVATFGILIAEAYQGQGLGKSLLKALLTEAKAQGYTKTAMHVMGSNSTAISLYQKYGFKEEARLTKAFQIDGNYVDGLIFAKDLEDDYA